MKLATYRPAQFIFVGLATLAVLAGCTLAGSSGIGDVTPVGGDGAIVVDPNTPEPGPPTSIPDAAPTISELERLSTQTAIDATAQAASGAQDTTGDDATTGSDSATPVPVVTSDLGGEFVAPTNTPIGVLGDGGAATTTDTSCPPTYTISAGENLYRIALQFGLTSQELAAANGIINPDQLSVGTVLNIPGCGGTEIDTATAGTGAVAPAIPSSATAYTVQPGDNLFRVSLQFNMTWTVLAAFNGLTNPNVIFPGQVLQIPQ